MNHAAAIRETMLMWEARVGDQTEDLVRRGAEEYARAMNVVMAHPNLSPEFEEIDAALMLGWIQASAVTVGAMTFEECVQINRTYLGRLPDRKFGFGEKVTKKSGACWTGHVCGYYRTALTLIGYAVESVNEPGSVQVYPEGALKAVEEPS